MGTDRLGAPAALAIDLLTVNGPLNRAALATHAGWARSTTSRVVSELISSGLVVEGEVVQSGHRGRPYRALTLNPDAGSGIGIDFGFRHVRAVIGDASQRIRGSAVRQLAVDYTPTEGIRVAAQLVEELLGTSGLPAGSLRGVGLAIPAPLNGSVVTRSSMIPTWVGHDPAAELEAILGIPVRGDNDSKLAALAETFWGVGRQYGTFLFFKLHSGIGGAVVIDGRLVGGSAGEFGHVSLDPDGPVCRCGERGCLELYAGIPAILGALHPAHGPLLTLREAANLLDAGDPAAQRVFREVAARIGQAAGWLCNAINPEASVLGGALSQTSGNHLLPEIVRSTRHSSLPANHAVAVVVSSLGPEASAMGAVRLAFTQLARKAPSATAAGGTAAPVLRPPQLFTDPLVNAATR